MSRGAAGQGRPCGTSSVAENQTTALYWARFVLVNAAASAVASTAKLFAPNTPSVEDDRTLPSTDKSVNGEL